MNRYVVEVKRKVWNKDGKFWFESTEESYAYANSWNEVKHLDQFNAAEEVSK